MIGIGLHEFVTDPTIVGALEPLHIDPKLWLILVLLGAITYAAHGHAQDA